MENNTNPKDNNEHLQPEQLVTKRDLQLFKEELFKELARLLPKSTNASQKQWLKSAEVRKMLNISPGTLQTLRINGTLAYTKLGGSIFYKLSDIEKVLENK